MLQWPNPTLTDAPPPVTQEEPQLDAEPQNEEKKEEEKE